jgi:hypothetical protein
VSLTHAEALIKDAPEWVDPVAIGNTLRGLGDTLRDPPPGSRAVARLGPPLAGCEPIPLAGYAIRAEVLSPGP